jgi:hypothetical protein
MHEQVLAQILKRKYICTANSGINDQKISLLALTLRLLRFDELIIADIVRTFLLLIIVRCWLRSFIGKLITKVSDNRQQIQALTHIVCIFDIRRRTPSQLFGNFA